MTTKRVDAHAHVIRRDAPLVAGRHSEPHRDATVEEFLSLLDHHGIARAVLTQPSFYGTDTSLLLEALRAHPDRFRGTAIVEPDIPESRLVDLRAGGIRGIRLNWFRRETLPPIARYAALFARLRELDLHVELYVEGRKLPDILPNILASGVHLVLDHFGSPEASDGVDGSSFRAVLQAVQAGRTWVKLSAPYRLGGAPAEPYARALVGAGGGERLMWGSDWPWISNETGQDYGQLLGLLSAWLPDENVREQVLCRTPAAFFDFA